MKSVLEELLELLSLEKIEENIFRGKSQDLGFGNIFGGQVLGQSLSAASQTVSDDRNVHSLHGYFLRAGDPKMAIIYNVDRLRDGKSFTTRRVVAIQKGRPIFAMSCSFQVNESGFEHQEQMPDIKGPEGIPSDFERLNQIQDRIPAKIRDKLLCEKPIEIRQVNPINPFKPQKNDPLKFAWFKTNGEMPDNKPVHQYMLAYASDFGLVSTSLYPHGHTYWEPDMQVASLDHSMWFHHDFRMDDWLLYVMKSPAASKARGLSQGSIFTRDGKLVASTTQEGLIRYHKFMI